MYKRLVEDGLGRTTAKSLSSQNQRESITRLEKTMLK